MCIEGTFIYHITCGPFTMVDQSITIIVWPTIASGQP